jgi:glyoxylase-like metal-dependent hydrolase (beta-lactamase superfamily II)
VNDGKGQHEQAIRIRRRHDEKKISFTEIGKDLWAFTAEGDPNTGVIIGDDSVMIVEAQATPALANKVIEKVRSVTDKPISHLVLTHYHAVRVLGAAAYKAPNIIMSEKAAPWWWSAAQEDRESEFMRFPRLFRADDEQHPAADLADDHLQRPMTVYLGKRRVDLMLPRPRAYRRRHRHSWVPDENVMFTGDIVEYHSACYCGDGHFQRLAGDTLE